MGRLLFFRAKARLGGDRPLKHSDFLACLTAPKQQFRIDRAGEPELRGTCYNRIVI
jgi:hypothetical protein